MKTRRLSEHIMSIRVTDNTALKQLQEASKAGDRLDSLKNNFLIIIIMMVFLYTGLLI